MSDKLTDKSEMPFGMHKGTFMEDVPAKYLLWMYDKGMQEGNVKRYIKENMKYLQEEDGS